MAFKPNYRQQRGDRVRAKDKKRQERIERRDAKRKDPETGETLPEESATDAASDPSAAAAAEEASTADNDDPAATEPSEPSPDKD